MLVPCTSPCCATRTLLTKVPLVEPTSTTRYRPVASITNCACRLADTSAASSPKPPKSQFHQPPPPPTEPIATQPSARQTVRGSHTLPAHFAAGIFLALVTSSLSLPHSGLLQATRSVLPLT